MSTQTDTKFNGFFRGQVLKHLDFGYCKIWIPGVYSEEYKQNPDSLPSAEQASPLFGGSVGGNGTFSYPNVNSIVWCFFQNGDQNLPVYFASTLGSGCGNRTFNDTHNGEMKDVDEKSGEKRKVPYGHIIKAGKSTVKIYDTGQIWIETSGKKGKTAIKMNHDGTLEISNDDMLQLHAKNIKIISNDTFEVDAGKIILNSASQLNEFSKNHLISSRETTSVISQNSPSGKMI